MVVEAVIPFVELCEILGRLAKGPEETVDIALGLGYTRATGGKTERSEFNSCLHVPSVKVFLKASAWL